MTAGLETLYTIREAAEHLKVSEVTIRRYIAEGKLESRMVGRFHRITALALAALH